MRASVGTYRTCRKTFIHFIFQIYLDQFYEAAGRPDTTSNSHQPILLSQSCQCLPKAPLEDGEKRAEQISSIMMEHRSRLGLQWICQYKNLPWYNQVEQQISALSLDPEDFSGRWHLDQHLFTSNGEFIAPFIHARIAPGQNNAGELQSSQINKYINLLPWNGEFFIPWSLHLCFSWTCSLTPTWFKASGSSDTAGKEDNCYIFNIATILLFANSEAAAASMYRWAFT